MHLIITFLCRILFLGEGLVQRSRASQPRFTFKSLAAWLQRDALKSTVCDASWCLKNSLKTLPYSAIATSISDAPPHNNNYPHSIPSISQLPPDTLLACPARLTRLLILLLTQARSQFANSACRICGCTFTRHPTSCQ